MPRTTLADVASDYVRKHQHERQCRQLDSNSRVTLTVIQNQWAKLAGQEPMTIFDAPEVVIRSIETTQRGHELFDRTKETNGVVYYGLKTERKQKHNVGTRRGHQKGNASTGRQSGRKNSMAYMLGLVPQRVCHPKTA